MFPQQPVAVPQPRKTFDDMSYLGGPTPAQQVRLPPNFQPQPMGGLPSMSLHGDVSMAAQQPMGGVPPMPMPGQLPPMQMLPMMQSRMQAPPMQTQPLMPQTPQMNSQPIQGGTDGQAPAYGPMQQLAMQMANYKPPGQLGGGAGGGGGPNPNQIGPATSQIPYQMPQAPVGYGPTPIKGGAPTDARSLQELSRNTMDTYLPPKAFNLDPAQIDPILAELIEQARNPYQQNTSVMSTKAGYIPSGNRY